MVMILSLFAGCSSKDDKEEKNTKTPQESTGDQTDPTDEEFMKIVEEAVAKSEYIIDEKITKDDKILTLSTCTGLFKQPKENYRMAIMAKLMPSNEIPVSQMTMKVEPNPNPLRD